MFLHLGGSTVIPANDLVAILNLETAKQGEATQEFLRTINEEGFVCWIAEPGKEKSFVITGKQIFLSPISAATLAKRATSFKATFFNNEN